MAKDQKPEIYQLALEAAPLGILVVDEPGNIRYANQTLANMFGHTVEELAGKPVEVLLPPQFANAHRHHVEKYTHKPEPRSMGIGRDLEGISKDGRRFPVEIGLRPEQTSSGKFVVATVIEITQRKAIERRLLKHEEQLEEMVTERTRELHEAQQEKERVLDQLIQAEKMTAVGTLVSGIGHEINNPLYVLYATAEILTNENNVSKCQAYGHDILKQAKKIAETVKSLSQYAQPGTRHDLQRVDINKTIADAVHLAQSTSRGNEIDFEISESPVPEILAKSEEIQQVLFNIVRNAIQAIEGKGKIKISTAQEKEWATIRIEDSGTGISNEHLKQIFDPFFTTKGPDEGEGLGLYIVRQIITRYQGTIDIENADQGGARFTIRFPITD